jgi:hypothetical protein
VSSLLHDPNLTGRHPDPPGDFDTWTPPLVVSASSWIRSHRTGYGPLFFGSTGQGRFDAPAGEYGILYVGSDAFAAFVETIGHVDASRHRPGWKIVTRATLAERVLAHVIPRRPLRLVDLHGPGLARIGADSRLTSDTGDRYAIPQRWALALNRHPSQPDGLLYRPRHDPSRLAAGIFDRAADAFDAIGFGSLADSANAGLLNEILEAYGFELFP